MKGFLVFTDSQGQMVCEFEIKKFPVLIGREQPCDVILSHPGISRIHAEISERGSELWVSDKGSSNGIELNGQKLHEAKLVEMQPVMMGDLKLEYRAENFEERTFIAVRRDPAAPPTPPRDFSEHTAIVGPSAAVDDLFESKTVIRSVNSNLDPIADGRAAAVKPPLTANFSFELKVPEFQKQNQMTAPTPTPGGGAMPPKVTPIPTQTPPSLANIPGLKPMVQPLPDDETAPQFQPLSEDVSLADQRESRVGKQMPSSLAQTSFSKGAPASDYLQETPPAQSMKKWLPVAVLSGAVAVAAYVFVVRGPSNSSAPTESARETRRNPPGSQQDSREQASTVESNPSSSQVEALGSLMSQMEKSYKKTQTEARSVR